MITTPSNEETKIAIDALLSLGNDIMPDNDITVENSALVPVGQNPSNTTVSVVVDKDADVQIPPNPPTLDQPEENNADYQLQPDPPAPTPTSTPPAQPGLDSSKLENKNKSSESTDSQSTSMDNPDNSKKKRYTNYKKFCFT